MKKRKSSYLDISPQTNIVFTIFIVGLAITTVAPYLLAMVVSISSKESLDLKGFSFFPESFSFIAYDAIFNYGFGVMNALLVTVVVTVIGTFLSILMTTTYGYVINRKTFRWRKQFTFFIFFTMLFNAGMVPNYMIIVRLLNLRDNIFALILPLVYNPFLIIMTRTFFQMTIPEAVIESAQMDGASEFRIYRSIVLPVSVPIVATVALFGVIGYWNSWFEALLYISDERLNTLQYLLIRIQNDIAFLQRNTTMIGPEANSLIQNLPSQSFMMALMVFSTFPLVFAYPFFQRYIVSGMTVGAVKG